jgi:hypothetical protein
MPAIWTNADDSVKRIYYDETDLSNERLDSAIVVDSIPDANEADDETSTLYYTDTDGFYYEYTQYPTRLKLPGNEGTRLVDAVESSDLQTVLDVIETVSRR